ncbi:hypothetical protein Fot_16338 [Forsythia ovata]|uniref:Uncharacterized protein n=1 Tax=Forsythia ovata TaxID=205694 RepID=A0ABD1WCA0_9LAMI
MDLEAEKTSKEPEKTTDDGSKTYQDIHKSASDWSTEFEPEKTTDDGSKTSFPFPAISPNLSLNPNPNSESSSIAINSTILCPRPAAPRLGFLLVLPILSSPLHPVTSNLTIIDVNSPILTTSPSDRTLGSEGSSWVSFKMVPFDDARSVMVH